MTPKMMIWIPFIIAICSIENSSSFTFESDENIQAIRNASFSINQFTFEAHKVMANITKQNFVTSPMSTLMVLLMAAYGARGKCAEEMSSVLHFDAKNTVYETGIHSLIEMLNAIKTSEVKVANNIYAADGIEIDPDYVNLIKKIFNSTIETVKFENSQETADKINHWCAEQTHQRIENIIDPSDISQNTMLVLINAVYFKALWSSAFEESDTYLTPFRLNEQETKEVPMMYQSLEATYGDLHELDAKFVQFYFKSENSYEFMSMSIIMANEIDRLHIIEENIHKLKLSDFKGETHQVNLWMPKFKVETEIDLENVLKKLGLVTPFHESADFSGICKKAMGMKIDKLAQKVVFDVNEYGIEAAAATDATLGFRFGKPQNPDLKMVDFKADRPFTYFIANKDTILFTGRIVDV